jgi:hypothetical protein
LSQSDAVVLLGVGRRLSIIGVRRHSDDEKPKSYGNHYVLATAYLLQERLYIMYILGVVDPNSPFEYFYVFLHQHPSCSILQII